MGVDRKAVLARQSEAWNERAKNATVAVLGCGGLGSNIAWMLARLGIGIIHIFDYDVIEPSNLNRQCYGIGDIGAPKVEATARAIAAALPFAEVIPHYETVDRAVLDRIYGTTDIFVEAFDGKETKAACFDYFIEKEKPYVCTTGVAGPRGEVERRTIGNVHIAGDFDGEDRNDCYIPKVMTIAALEAQAVLELLWNEEE